MADLTIADEHVDTSSEDTILEPTAEQEEADLDSAFDEDDADETNVDDAEVEDGADESGEKNADEELEAEKEDNELDEEKTPDEIAAQKVIDDAKIAEDAKKVDPPKKVEPAPELTAEEKEAAQKKADDVRTQARDSLLTDIGESLKDVIIGDGGDEDNPMPKTIGEFAEMFPEIANSTNQMMAAMYDKIMGEVNPLRDSISDSQAKESESALISELSSDEFGHADVSEIIASTEFQDWVADQTPAYQSYVEGANTAKDVSSVLTTYKAQAGIESPAATAKAESKAKAETIAEKQRATKKAKDDLGRASTRTKKTITKTSAGETEDDLDAIFDEDDD